MRKEGRASVLLDGRDLRRVVGEGLGFSSAERREVAERLCRLCEIIEEQSVEVICPVAGLFPDVLEKNRTRFVEYYEVYVRVPFEVIEQRDQDGLYSGARAGRYKNVVGIDVPFEPPKASDLIVDNGLPLRNPEELAGAIMVELNARDFGRGAKKQ